MEILFREEQNVSTAVEPEAISIIKSPEVVDALDCISEDYKELQLGLSLLLKQLSLRTWISMVSGGLNPSLIKNYEIKRGDYGSA